MKTRNDRTISFTIIGFGLFFISIVAMIDSTPTLSTLAWVCFGTIIILAGIWTIETFEISDDTLTKTNFIGLYRRKVNLNSIVRYEKKSFDFTHFLYKNPFSIIRLFSKDNKYFVYRQISIITEGDRKMKIDERTINADDFKKLYNKIKGYKSQQKS